jgi:hypothetical protein
MWPLPSILATFETRCSLPLTFSFGFLDTTVLVFSFLVATLSPIWLLLHFASSKFQMPQESVLGPLICIICRSSKKCHPVQWFYT